jgi:hypothetical protein
LFESDLLFAKFSSLDTSENQFWIFVVLLLPFSSGTFSFAFLSFQSNHKKGNFTIAKFFNDFLYRKLELDYWGRLTQNFIQDFPWYFYF